MSYIKHLMKHDERLIRREIRNVRLSEETVNHYLGNLSDVSTQARWMHPDGLPCNEDETQSLLMHHEKGGNKLSYSVKKD